MSTVRCLIRKPTDLNGIGGLNVQDGSEASVEEILDSIKKVIARDNRAGALEARRMRSRSTREDAAPAPRDPVLEEEAEEQLTFKQEKDILRSAREHIRSVGKSI